MASVITSEVPEEQRFMSDFWNLRKQFYNGEEQEEFWAELIDHSDELSRKYQNSYFDQLILVCVDDIDRRYMASIGRPWKSDPVRNVYERIQKRKGMPV